MLTRIETKVWAGLAGVFAGLTALTPTVLWLLGVLVWHVPNTAAHADEAIGAVPWPVALVVGFILTGGAATTLAYKAPPSNHAGNNSTGVPMDDSTAGHDELT